MTVHVRAASLEEAVEYTGVRADEGVGRVAAPGDVNGDGYADLFIGSCTGEDGGTDTGTAHLGGGIGDRSKTSRSFSDQDVRNVTSSKLRCVVEHTALVHDPHPMRRDAQRRCAAWIQRELGRPQAAPRRPDQTLIGGS